MRFREFLEALEDPEKKAELDKKMGEIRPIKVKPSIKTKDDPNKTKAALNLKDIMAMSKRIGHTPSVAHAVGIYPA